MDTLRGNIVAGPLTTTEYSIDAKSWSRFQLPIGQRLRIEASGSWGFDGATHGPEGQQGRLDGRSPGHPKAPLGMLIGGISGVRVDGAMDENTAKQVIWGINTIPVGAYYQGATPGHDAYLYLAINDAWGTYGDNHGALTVKFTIG